MDAFAKGFELVPSVEEMQAWDAASVRHGIPDPVLMENAARSALRVLLSRCPDVEGKKVSLFMGSGNNGGDAADLSRHLLDLGARPTVYHMRHLDILKGSGAIFARAARECGVPFLPMSEWDGSEADIVIDGLLGTGFSAELSEEYRKLIERINEVSARAFVLALDVPSGLNSMSGKPNPVAIRANATATFAGAKPGLLLPCARPWTGDLCICAIGTPKKVREESPCSYRGLCAGMLESFDGVVRDGFKNSYGHVLVLGGAPGMSGAARIAAKAALRAGCGLVSVASPVSGAASVQNDPEIMSKEVGLSCRGLWPSSLYELSDKMSRASALVAGPGMGRGKDAEKFLEALLALPDRPATVFDADALVLLGRSPRLFERLAESDVLTPHPGEAAAMLGVPVKDVSSNRFDAIKKLSSLSKASVLLKGAGALIRQENGPVCILPADVPQLSCAGSGDALAGLVGALLARGLPSFHALALGVVWHASAGAVLSERYPLRGNTAGEIADALPAALARAEERLLDKQARIFWFR